jgi:hypothetical protein
MFVEGNEVKPRCLPANSNIINYYFDMRSLVIIILAVVLAGFTLSIPEGCQPRPADVTKAGPPSAGASEIDNPWATCGKGSFIHYRVMNPLSGSFAEQRQTVVDVQPNKVLLETATLVNNEWRSEGVLELSLTPLDKPAGAMKFAEQAINIGGQAIQCKVVERTVSQGDKTATARDWMSKEVPGGLVRKEMAGQVVWEVIGFARKQ